MSAPNIPNVVIGAPIGGGNFGVVYRGRHQTLDVDVAVKIGRTDTRWAVDAALHEARLMARLDHPNLLRIFDAGPADDSLYLVLELMDATCERVHGLAADRAEDLTRQLLGGLQALHDARILHRDIKPANCLLRSRDNRVKLADLGIAVEETTRTRQRFELAGTLPFMAPELFAEPPQFSPASDLYALGVTLQCLVLDENPYPAGGMQVVMGWIHGGVSPRVADRRPDLPRPLATLIDRLCARAIGERPRDAAAAIAAIAPSAAPTIVLPSEGDRSPRQIGSWVLGADIPGGDANFRHYAVSHGRSGAAGRMALLKERCPLSGTSALIVESAERASRFDHPGIADVVDWGMHADRAYVVTRSQGQTLKTIVEASGPFDELEALDMTRQLADALAYLHEAGFVYQVVNPLFAMVGRDARTVQLAWPMFCVPTGSSSATVDDASRLVFVPVFAPPEALVRPPRDRTHAVQSPSEAAPASIGDYQVIRRLDETDHDDRTRITERLDVYGLGEILFYLIAGRPARKMVADHDLTVSVLPLIVEKMSGPARLRDAVPGVSALTAQLVADATAPDPAKRPANAAVVRDRLDRIARGLR